VVNATDPWIQPALIRCAYGCSSRGLITVSGQQVDPQVVDEVEGGTSTNRGQSSPHWGRSSS
jgi:hypothetical protein